MVHIPQQLTFQGSVVLLAGLLAGIPLGRSINANDATRAQSWRIAHTGLVGGAILLFAVAAITPLLRLPRPWAVALMASLILATYAFAVSLSVGAWKGERGLSKSGSDINRILYFLNIVGVVASLIAAVVLIAGSARAL